jgi:hypothetical protein
MVAVAPDAPIEAIPVLELTHVPPGVALLNVVVAASHTVADPVIAAGVAMIVITFMAGDPHTVE